VGCFIDLSDRPITLEITGRTWSLAEPLSFAPDPALLTNSGLQGPLIPALDRCGFEAELRIMNPDQMSL
jgi:hypothetical protein